MGYWHVSPLQPLCLQQNIIVLSVDESKKDKYIPNMTEYQKLVGKLIYLSVTRPDITYVVHYLSHHMHAPLQSHFAACLRMLRGGVYIFKDLSEHYELYHGGCDPDDGFERMKVIDGDSEKNVGFEKIDGGFDEKIDGGFDEKMTTEKNIDEKTDGETGSDENKSAEKKMDGGFDEKNSDEKKFEGGFDVNSSDKKKKFCVRPTLIGKGPLLSKDDLNDFNLPAPTCHVPL
ncbi:ribonuclease H-like domain-containing protein [Tanacetum coccineum]